MMMWSLVVICFVVTGQLVSEHVVTGGHLLVSDDAVTGGHLFRRDCTVGYLGFEAFYCIKIKGVKSRHYDNFL